MYRVDCKIDGIVPLMQDRYYDVSDEPAGEKDKADWKKDLPKKAYIDDVGMYVPADSVRMMLIGNKLRTGSSKILGSQIEKGKGTKYHNFCKACVWVIGPDDPLKAYLDPQRKTFDDYDERTFINSTGGRSITRRPLATLPWSLRFFVDVTEDTLGESKVRQLFEVAGMRCGCGAYGPTFGRFVISEWKLVE